MLTDIRRAHRYAANTLDARWPKRLGRRPWYLFTDTVGGTPFLVIGRGPVALVRWLGLQVLYFEPDGGWSKRTTVTVRADIEIEVFAMLRFFGTVRHNPLTALLDMGPDLPPTLTLLMGGKVDPEDDEG